MKTKKSKVLIALAILLSLIISLLLTSCGGAAEKPTTDREGNSITLPDGKIEKIISFGAALTEIIVGLDLADKLVAIDTYATDIPGLAADLPQFDMFAPEIEQIVNLNPDVFIVTSMAKIGGDDPYKSVKDAGICVIYIPSSASINDIKEDIRFIANVMGVKSKGDSIIKDMEKKIADIKKIGDSIAESDKKSVYFEIDVWGSAFYSCGKSSYMNEIIEIAGAVNAFKNEPDVNGWLNLSEEVILDKNPDVILTSINYIPDIINEIKARPGWDSMTAVQNNAVYYIDTNASSRPTQNITKALDEIAKAVYPDKYK